MIEFRHVVGDSKCSLILLLLANSHFHPNLDRIFPFGKREQKPGLSQPQTPPGTCKWLTRSSL